MKKILLSLVLLFLYSTVFCDIYVVELEFKQTSFTLDIGQHIKNNMNKLSINIPVIKEFYDAVNVGDEINKSFKIGSLIFDGDFERGKVVVKNKRIIQDNGQPIVINTYSSSEPSSANVLENIEESMKYMQNQRQKLETKLELIERNKKYKKKYFEYFPKEIQDEISKEKLGEYDFSKKYDEYLPQNKRYRGLFRPNL